MVTDLDGNRIPYVGYKRSIVDKEVLYIHDNLSKGEQRRVKKIVKGLDETEYEYLEEVLIDYEYASKIASEVIDKGIISGMSKLELALLMLLFGIGVAKRKPEEIALISGQMVKEIDELEYYFRDNFFDTIDVIYDEIMKYITSSEIKKQITLK